MCLFPTKSILKYIKVQYTLYHWHYHNNSILLPIFSENLSEAHMKLKVHFSIYASFEVYSFCWMSGFNLRHQSSYIRTEQTKIKLRNGSYIIWSFLFFTFIWIYPFILCINLRKRNLRCCGMRAWF